MMAKAKATSKTNAEPERGEGERFVDKGNKIPGKSENGDASTIAKHTAQQSKPATDENHRAASPNDMRLKTTIRETDAVQQLGNAQAYSKETVVAPTGPIRAQKQNGQDTRKVEYGGAKKENANENEPSERS